MSNISPFMSATLTLYITLYYLLYFYRTDTLPLHYIRYPLLRYLTLLFLFTYYILALFHPSLESLVHSYLLLRSFHYSTHSHFTFHLSILQIHNILILTTQNSLYYLRSIILSLYIILSLHITHFTFTPLHRIYILLLMHITHLLLLLPILLIMSDIFMFIVLLTLSLVALYLYSSLLLLLILHFITHLYIVHIYSSLILTFHILTPHFTLHSIPFMYRIPPIHSNPLHYN